MLRLKCHGEYQGTNGNKVYGFDRADFPGDRLSVTATPGDGHTFEVGAYYDFTWSKTPAAALAAPEPAAPAPSAAEDEEKSAA